MAAMAWGCRHAAKSFPRCIMDSGLGIRVRVSVGKDGGHFLGQTGAKRGDKNGDLQYVFYEIRWFNRFIRLVFQHFEELSGSSAWNHTHIPMAFMDLDGIKLCVSVPLPNTKSLPNFVHIPSFFLRILCCCWKGPWTQFSSISGQVKLQWMSHSWTATSSRATSCRLNQSWGTRPLERPQLSPSIDDTDRHDCSCYRETSITQTYTSPTSYSLYNLIIL